MPRSIDGLHRAAGALLATTAACILCLAATDAHAQRQRHVGSESGMIGTLTVEISPLRDADGMIRAALYDSGSTWLSTGGASASCVAHARSGAAQCTFGPVEVGRYALAVLHDEDGNGRMDHDWAGLPSEGYAFSNDAPTIVGPPSFGSAQFTHGAADQTLHVHARYGP